MSDYLKEKLSSKIKLCLQDRDIPKECQSIILKLWPSALFKILKSHGDQTPQWNNAIRMYIDLIDSIQPISNIEQFRQLKEHFISIARSNNSTLLLYHTPDSVESGIKSLISYYNFLLGTTKKSGFSSNNQPAALEKIATLPSNIKPGIWCELYVDENTPARRLRLSVINMQNGNLIFVNRNGIKKLEKDALVFSAELKEGLSKVYKHDALFTRTLDEDDARFQKII